MKNQKYILSFLLLAIISLMVVPSIPHHHHFNGEIHISYAEVENDSNDENIHHDTQNGDDHCCDDSCQTRFNSRSPLKNINQTPSPIIIAMLFYEFANESLFQPQLHDVEHTYFYLESLHGADYTCASSLRGPPYSYQA